MLKHILLAGVLGLASLSVAHAQEDPTQCDDNGLQMLQSAIDGESNQANKETATASLTQAQADLQAGNLDQCAVHMGEARQALTAQ